MMSAQMDAYTTPHFEFLIPDPPPASNGKLLLLWQNFWPDCSVYHQNISGKILLDFPYTFGFGGSINAHVTETDSLTMLCDRHRDQPYFIVRDYTIKTSF